MTHPLAPLARSPLPRGTNKAVEDQGNILSHGSNESTISLHRDVATACLEKPQTRGRRGSALHALCWGFSLLAFA